MVFAGADRYRAHVDRARRKGQMSTLTTHRRLIRQWIPIIVDGIEQTLWNVEKSMRDHGPIVRPISYDYLKHRLDHGVAAWIALRCIFDTISTKRHCGLMYIAVRIGTELEHEAKMQAWEAQDRKLYYGVRRALKRNRSTMVHRRRVRINRFNKLVRQEIAWQDWSHDDRRSLGLDLIDIVLRHTRRFDVVPDPFQPPAGKRPKFVLVAKHDLTRWLMKAEDRAELLTPLYLPTLMPPKRWQSTKEGAYYTPYTRVPALIRFKAYQEDQRGAARAEYDALDMPEVYAALHTVQEVPWRINTRVLDVAQQVWDSDLAIAGMPPQADDPLPPTAPEDASEEEIRAAKRARAETRKRNIRKSSGVLVADRTLAVAQRFRKETFYYPHMLDFRGRMYPIPTDLQPQGQDLARGLLTFAESRPVLEADAGWLAIHVANCFGFDKISHDERIQWTEERWQDWQAVDEDPLAARAIWQDADSPWQALAAILEWVAYVKHGPGYESSLPVRIDATCSGLQHLSALTRDLDSGKSVNLTDAESPQDIYQDVADTLTKDLERIQKAGGRAALKAKHWLDLCDGRLPRSITKRPVMILPYGGTREAYFQYTLDWVEEHHPEWIKRFTPGQYYKHVSWLRDRMWKAVGKRVTGGLAVMAWLQACAVAASKGNQPVYWTTPAGFVVRHFYGKFEGKVIRTRLDDQVIPVDFRPKRTGKRNKLKVWDVQATKEMDIVAQRRGIPPNYVHSMDACVLMLAINRLRDDDGVTSLTCIHDAIGALAADMRHVNEAMRLAFVETHECPLLDAFREQCKEIISGHLQWTEQRSQQDADELADAFLPELLPKGKLDLDDVLEAHYFLS